MNIALIVGGISSEREVSLTSGKGILKALRSNGHNVKVIDPVFGSEEISEEIIFKDLIKEEYPSLEVLKNLQGEKQKNILTCINSKLFDDIDIAFLGLHGKFGEDGKIQTILELRGIKYTGSDIISSGIAMDKNISKILFRKNNIPVADWVAINKNENFDLKSIADSFGLPLVVKPNDEGSTVGLSIVDDINKLKEAVNLAFEYSNKILIEKYIKGRELTATILGGKAYPVIEIIPNEGFYDYQHKYKKGKTQYICPAEIPADTAKKAQEYALTAHNTLGCSVYSRVDFILDENNNLFCLEVNTLPGMTELSLVPKSVKADGIEFEELIQRILDLSLMKYQDE